MLSFSQNAGSCWRRGNAAGEITSRFASAGAENTGWRLGTAAAGKLEGPWLSIGRRAGLQK